MEKKNDNFIIFQFDDDKSSSKSSSYLSAILIYS